MSRVSLALDTYEYIQYLEQSDFVWNPPFPHRNTLLRKAERKMPRYARLVWVHGEPKRLI